MVDWSENFFQTIIAGRITVGIATTHSSAYIDCHDRGVGMVIADVFFAEKKAIYRLRVVFGADIVGRSPVGGFDYRVLGTTFFLDQMGVAGE